MKSLRWTEPLLVALCMAGAPRGRARAAPDEVQAVSKEQLAKFDKGPTSIDVSRCTRRGLKENYAAFRPEVLALPTLWRGRSTAISPAGRVVGTTSSA